jgi:hypothetical protein
MRLADDPTGITGLPSCAFAVAGECIKPLERSHAEVCERWQADRPQVATSLQMPQAQSCDPGMSATNSLEDALRRLNLYRWLGGAQPLALDAEWNDYARACAIIQSYIGPEISHFPAMDAPCFTEKGYTASGQSQLAYGQPNPAAAIDALIYDDGDNNFHVLGHRQGMLLPGTSTVGLGFAQPANGPPATCVRTFDDSPVDRPPGLPGIYTFPSPGHQPWELVADSTYMMTSNALEWSVTLPVDTDSTNGKVRLLRLRGSTWEDVPVTAGPYTDARFFGMWINPGLPVVEPGSYAVIVSGTSVGDFGYQIVLEQCTEVPLSCDVLAQDCGAGIGCYDPDAPFCRTSKGLPVGSPCTGWDNAECVPGAACASAFFTGTPTCTRYCDPDSTTAANACDVLCPGRSFEVLNESLEVVGMQCRPEADDACDPLAPQCGEGLTCQGFDPTVCRPVGVIGLGQECGAAVGVDCVAGATCIRTAESEKASCQPYCDPAAGTALSCDTLCSNDHFDFDGYGVCVPLE